MSFIIDWLGFEILIEILICLILNISMIDWINSLIFILTILTILFGLFLWNNIMVLRLNKRSIEIEWKWFPQIARIPFNLRNLCKSWIHRYTLIPTNISASTEPFESIPLCYEKLGRFFWLFNRSFLVSCYGVEKVISWLYILIFLNVQDTFTSICMHLIFLRNLWLIV